MKQIGGNAIVIKEVNVNFVRKALKTQRRATKQQLAQATGLSIVTVGTVLRLFAAGGRSSGGRADLFERKTARNMNITPNMPWLFFYFLTNRTERSRLEAPWSILWAHSFLKRTNRSRRSTCRLLNESSTSDSLVSFMRAIGLGLPGAEYDGKMIVSDYEALLAFPLPSIFAPDTESPSLWKTT
ncbi:hypothetical protein [Cohnella faecalis]|uniref:hypothetical protein n=1 Tax=Cohnella faecalis TaxID=2315694 RepID=UPI001F331314|nr:hypothetical protein [Cohnella faecalis]